MQSVQRLFFWRSREYIKKEINRILRKAEKYSVVDKPSKEMIENILEFSHILVREIMIPRTEIKAINTEGKIEEIIREIVDSRHTRIPFYRGTIDNIIGVLNVKNLLNFWPEQFTKEGMFSIFIKPYYIPETKNTNLLFHELKENKKHLAIVIDEYGGTSGLVTLEDLLEEIVGEIHDEHESNAAADGIFQAPDGSLIVDGRMEIEKIEESLNVGLGKGRYETLSGMILNVAKRIPLTGEKFIIDGLEISIEKADERSIKKVKIRKFKANVDEK
jgi:CBS domain containing-hemolysin-like protein